MCPFQNQSLCGLAVSASESGREIVGAKRIWPWRLMVTLAGDFAASGGSLTRCFEAKVAGSYSTISPVELRTHRRFV